jgi:hypothetical protein
MSKYQHQLINRADPECSPCREGCTGCAAERSEVVSASATQCPNEYNSLQTIMPSKGAGTEAPDKYCVTEANGECVSTDPRCMHQVESVDGGARPDSLENILRFYTDRLSPEAAKDLLTTVRQLLATDGGARELEQAIQEALDMLICQGSHTGDEYSGCPAWGFHRPEGRHYRLGDEDKCTCGYATTIAKLRAAVDRRKR